MATKNLKLRGVLSAVALLATGIGVSLAAGSLPPSIPFAPPMGENDPLALSAIAEDAPAKTHSFKSSNFIAYAPTKIEARVIANEAEHHRRELAMRWLGKELPNWSRACEIRFTPSDKAAGGSTSFSFTAGKPGVSNVEMTLNGGFMKVLENALPHEVMHCVLATHFGKPVPRWADEGIAVHSESAEEGEGHDLNLRKILADGRAMHLKHLFKMKDYGRDMIVLYAQGQSVVKFMLSKKPTEKTRTPHSSLLEFLRIGSDENTVESWNKAAKSIYGYDSVDDVEAAWIEWLKKPENLNVPKPTPAKEVDPTLIPPINLPDAETEAWTDFGKLVACPLALDGRLTFALETAPGVTHLYVVAGPSLKMEEYKNRTVKVYGVTHSHPNTSKPFIVATKVELEK